MAGTFAAGYRGDPVDNDPAVLAGLLEASRRGVDLSRAALHAGLRVPHGAAGTYAQPSKISTGPMGQAGTPGSGRQ